MAVRLREHPGDAGVVGACSGLLTKPGLSVWSTTPVNGGPLVADLREQAKAATPVVESIAGYEGPATVASYTVQYDEQQDPATVSVIADTPAGARCVAVATDAALAARAIHEDIIGQPIRVSGTTFEA
jgi:acetyl-CoA C-acetyltransferase